MHARGFEVWRDEQELRLGSALSASLRKQVEATDAVVVIASAASASSTWVALELAHAREHQRPIVPLFIEAVATAEPFRDHVGVEALTTYSFAFAIETLIAGIARSLQYELPAPDADRVLAALRELSVEQPNLAPLIEGCLDGEELHDEAIDTVTAAPFHALDYALNALFDVKPGQLIAAHAADSFGRVGAGAYALSRWIKASGDGDLQLVSAVSAELPRQAINVAIDLLRAASPPNDRALHSFIHRNVAQFDPTQRRSVLRLVTHPVRDPAGSTDLLGEVALKAFPDAQEIRSLWRRWITSGKFDGTPRTPYDLANYLASEEPTWEDMRQELRSHIRHLARSKDKDKVAVAVGHLMAHAHSKTST
ncbi:MAG: TIR domain-containing protein, partial [Steroidobacteraceae bacterium]